MTGRNYIIVHRQTGIIDNRVYMEDGYNWSPSGPYDMYPEQEGFEIGGTYINGVYTPPNGNQGLKESIDRERELRITFPLTVTVPSGQVFAINMDGDSQRNIQGLSTVGMYLISLGSSQTTPFRDYNNVTRNLTPSDLVAMGLQAAARIQFLYQKSWDIKAMDPIPLNYKDASYWS